MYVYATSSLKINMFMQIIPLVGYPPISSALMKMI